jgi:hypothetical protein
MYASVRTYAGDRDLADTLAAREDEVRQVIGGINSPGASGVFLASQHHEMSADYGSGDPCSSWRSYSSWS